MICIPLTQDKYAIIDIDDLDIVSKYKWCAGAAGRQKSKVYAISRHVKPDGRVFTVRMHRIILGVTQSDIFVDHIDGNTLNNTRSNLRPCTPRQNALNSKAPCTNTSGFKGAFLSKQSGRWYSRITDNGKRINLGTFATAEDAHLAYCKAAASLYGEFAKFK